MAENQHSSEETVATPKQEEPAKAVPTATLRDTIAVAVLTGVLSQRAHPAGSEAALSAEAYTYADKMLEAREPKKEQGKAAATTLELKTPEEVSAFADSMHQTIIGAQSAGQSLVVTQETLWKDAPGDRMVVGTTYTITTRMP